MHAFGISLPSIVVFTVGSGPPRFVAPYLFQVSSRRISSCAAETLAFDFGKASSICLLETAAIFSE